MKKKVLKLMGDGLFALALVVNAQSGGTLTEMQEANLEAIAESRITLFDLQIWYVTDITWDSWTCYPNGSTGCPQP